MIVLTLTAEKAIGEADLGWESDLNTWGEVVIRLGSHEIGRRPLTYNQWDDGRDGLEQAAAEWFQERLAK